MKDFFEQFKENLEGRPEPPFDEHLWNRLNRGLDEGTGRTRILPVWWWSLGGILLLLMATNLFSILELRKVNQQLFSMEQKTDTIYLTEVKTNTIYKTDTLIQTQVVRNDIVRYVSRSANNPFTSLDQFNQSAAIKQVDFLSEINESRRAQLSLLAYLSQKENQTKFIDELENQNEALNYEAIAPLPFLQLESIANKTPFIIKDNLNEVQKEKRKTLSNHFYTMRPKGLQLGATGGWLNFINDDLNNKNGYTVGAQASIEFSPQVQLWASALFGKASISSKKINPTFPEPIEGPPSDDFVFEVVDAEPSFVQYAVGLQYFFNARKKWKPFIGLGYSAEQQYAFNVQYEYKLESQSLEWDTKDRRPTQTISDLLLIRAGLEYQFADHWNWQLKADFRSDLNNRNLLAPNLLNLQTGLNYRF